MPESTATQYQSPERLSDLYACLRTAGSDGILIAGGQSLLPALFSGVVTQRRLIDVGRIKELQHLSSDGDRVVIGSGVHLTDLMESDCIQRFPAVRQALSHVGTVTIRNRATVGGNLAWADPRAELPLALMAYDAVIKTDRRTIAAVDFPLGANRSTLEPQEVILEVELRAAQSVAPARFVELIQRNSAGKAIVSLVVIRHEGGLRVGVGGLVDRPVTVECSSIPEARHWIATLDAAYPALADAFHPLSYRQQMAKVLLGRVCEEILR